MHNYNNYYTVHTLYIQMLIQAKEGQVHYQPYLVCSIGAAELLKKEILGFLKQIGFLRSFALCYRGRNITMTH